MYKNQFKLLTTRRFLPLFITQFLGAFNDNVFKNALIIFITYVIADQLSMQAPFLVTLTGCIFILPMMLLSAQAGSFADKFEKTKLTRIIKITEIILMILGAIGFYTHNISLLLFVLFGLGVHSTFFGPIKYSILPDHLKDDELLGGNGLIEMGTFVSILIGNILGALFIMHPEGSFLIACLTISTAVLGYISARFIPKAPPPVPGLKLSWNFIKETKDVVQFTAKRSDLFLCILGISWFWFIGFTFLTELPSYTKDFMHANEQIFAIFLAIFSVGVGIGSGLCNRILKGKIEATCVPWAAFGITLFTLDLFLATLNEPSLLSSGELLTPSQFIGTFNHWRIMIDLFFIAISAGIYVVPLYTLLQHNAENSHKARVIASTNVINSFFMVIAAVIIMILLEYNVTIPEIFLMMGLFNLIAVVVTRELIPKKKEVIEKIRNTI